MPALRQAVARHQQRYGLELDPDTQVLVTVGATEVISASVLDEAVSRLSAADLTAS